MGLAPSLKGGKKSSDLMKFREKTKGEENKGGKINK